MANQLVSAFLMEPMIPPPGQRELEDLAVTLVEKSARMAAQLHPMVQNSIGDLVRSMNCYYSNLIEGHNTSPRDIERALAEDFSTNSEKRDLQLEAKAHIEVQSLVDRSALPFDVFSSDTVKWLHKEFYERLPESLCEVINQDTGKRIVVVPGEYRTSDVVVGRHIPPRAEYISQFLQRFSQAYNFAHLSRTEQIIAVTAAHHRLLWIHPFYDGNGRVARLLSHAAFRQAGVGNTLWSIARGLARNSQLYKSNLDLADSPREGDLDGRGNLSQKHLINFCRFFLMTAIDQVDFMLKLLDVSGLMDRIDSYSINQIQQKKLPKGSSIVLKEALLKGMVARGAIPTLTGYADRQSRTIISSLVKKGLLASDTPYGDLYLRFPQEVVEFYFPLLYPANS
jgi:Fic family protein